MTFIRKICLWILGVSVLFVSILPHQETLAAVTWFWQNMYVNQIGVPGTEDAEEKGHDAQLLDAAKKFINWMLWMLATIALVICLYAWFKMLTAWSDDGKYKEGFKLIKNAWLGLLIIGLSWMIVRFIMWIIQNLTADPEP